MQVKAGIRVLLKYPSWFCYEMKIENNHSRAKWEWRASLQPWPQSLCQEKSWFPLCPDGATPCAKDILAMTKVEDRAWRASNAKVRRVDALQRQGAPGTTPQTGELVLGQWLHQWVSLNSWKPTMDYIIGKIQGSTSYFLIWVIFTFVSLMPACISN